ncbi:hypothetical protein NHX12_003389 [Muraenolepis orangiensis]|uniref:Cyclin-dependent kinase inhibitor 1B n=1 Tax=Muraenolepis orangiensis TaxID=630683 RepID=A0A9Q0DWF4_9TELE|nr:hypothetical protein NHX12_003389 [Muraenolepis orangiensis]
MSNVRLSNGSPTVGVGVGVVVPSEEQHHQHHPKPSFCRSLFGPVDNDELKRDLKEHLTEMEEGASAKWNFDFASHTPLEPREGRFVWEAVACTALPPFYSNDNNKRPQRPSKSKSKSSKSKSTTGNNNNNNNQDDDDDVDLNGNHQSCVASSGSPPTPPPPPPPSASATGPAAEDGERRCCEGQVDDCGEQRPGGPWKRAAGHVADTATQSKRSHTSSDEVRCLNLTLGSSEHTPRKPSPKRQT